MALAAALRCEEARRQLERLHEERLQERAYAAQMEELRRPQQAKEGGKRRRPRRPRPRNKPGDGLTAAQREDLAIPRLEASRDLSLPALMKEYCASTCAAARRDIRVLAARLHIAEAHDARVLEFQAEVRRIAAGLALPAAAERDLFAAFTKAAKDRARGL
jgi:hypothetical protein